MLLPPIGAIEVIIENLDEVLLELDQHDQLIASGVASVGEAAGYALVWEWGNARQTKVGPETCRGVNPDGTEVWLSVQAPYGYIALNSPLYWVIIEEELKKVKFGQTNARALTLEFEKAMQRIAKQVLPIIRDAAPKDSGALRSSFEVVSSDDTSLEEDSTGLFSVSTEGKWKP